MESNGTPPEKFDHRFVDGKSGIGIDNFVALFDQSQDGEEDNWLAAGNDHHLLRCHSNMARSPYLLGDRFPECGQPGRRAVVSPPSPQGAYPRLYDVARSIEIGLADFKVHDVSSLRLKGPGASQYLEGGFRPKPLHAFGQF